MSLERQLANLNKAEHDIMKILDIASYTCELLSEIDPNSEEAILQNSMEYIKLSKEIQKTLIDHLENVTDENILKNTISSYEQHKYLEISSMKTVVILKQIEKLKEIMNIE